MQRTVPQPRASCCGRRRFAARPRPACSAQRSRTRASAAAELDAIDVDASVIDTRVPVTIITGYLGRAVPPPRLHLCRPAPDAPPS